MAKHELTDADRKKAKASRDASIFAQKERMLQALQKHYGFIKQAAKEAGIDRRTHLNWLANDPDYAEAVELLQEDNLDVSEYNLMKQIEKGNIQAIAFHLKHKGASRGYGTRMNEASISASMGSGEESIVTAKLVWADEE